ncbi:MAG TPA: TIGR02300 family protein [Allosphingosinicella sp.]|nr:TIGR02300 family protein [Allosphingosinicella sp.]
MVNPEWGTKRTCPKCATRFYDLGKDDPITCIACGINWHPEPVLKSKQPMPFEAAVKPEAEVEKEDADLAADELGIDVDEEAEENPDDEVDLGGDDDIGVPAPGDEEEV